VGLSGKADVYPLINLSGYLRRRKTVISKRL
jgi:hypothetical protein